MESEKFKRKLPRRCWTMFGDECRSRLFSIVESFSLSLIFNPRVRVDSSSKCKTVKLIPESITIDSFIFVSYRSLKSLLRSDTREIVLEGRRGRIVSCDGIRVTYWKNELDI